MRPIRHVVASAILIAVLGSTTSCGATPPPLVTDTMSGVYRVTTSRGILGIWTFTSCGPGCAAVSSAATADAAAFSGKAERVNGNWTLAVERVDAILCSDGALRPGTSRYVWYGSLSGFFSATGVLCNGSEGSTLKQEITLTKVRDRS